MKDRPIIFSGPMVRAILAGTKTQTRRVMSPQLTRWKPNEAFLAWKDEVFFPGEPDGCPYGVPGDRLWVRETWRIVGWHEGEPLWIEYAAGGNGEPNDNDWPEEDKDIELRSQCDEDCRKAGLTLNSEHEYSWPKDQSAPTRWRPSIFMPRAVSRITLELTEVRVQRLQEISEQDAQAEGARYFPDIPAGKYGDNGTRWSMKLDSPPDTDHCLSKASLAFGQAWNEINAKRGHGWDANPWVWALTFRRVV